MTDITKLGAISQDLQMTNPDDLTPRQLVLAMLEAGEFDEMKSVHFAALSNENIWSSYSAGPDFNTAKKTLDHMIMHVEDLRMDRAREELGNSD